MIKSEQGIFLSKVFWGQNRLWEKLQLSLMKNIKNIKSLHVCRESCCLSKYFFRSTVHQTFFAGVLTAPLMQDCFGPIPVFDHQRIFVPILLNILTATQSETEAWLNLHIWLIECYIRSDQTSGSWVVTSANCLRM